jgi:hypothetical protein
MLSALVLNSDATLNNFIVIGTKEFISGSAFTLVLRTINTELSDLRYVPASTSTIKIIVQKSNGAEVEISGTYETDDRSISRYQIDATQSETIIGGNIQFKIDVLGDGTQIIKGFVQNGLSKLIDGDC